MVFEIEKRSPTSHELSSLEAFSATGFLLYRQPYQESDLIVDLLLDNDHRLSALVRGGQKSIKRFGGKLEPLKILRLQLRAPKGAVTFDKLFSVEAADVVEVFDEYKNSYQALSEGLFYTELLRDLFPKGHLENWIYRDSLKVLVAGNHLANDEAGDWRRLYVWCYFSKELGFGVLGDRGLFAQSLGEEDYAEWIALFEDKLFSERTVNFIQRQSGKVLEKKVLRDLYSDWMQRSHLKCKSLESWIML